ncbi:MAG: hypothetical protein ACD_75C02225G0001 [uncultured bacterium]|nr:MAG: hypothetical protein ACD_75C02225G0001 [uncultured bacterium]
MNSSPLSRMPPSGTVPSGVALSTISGKMLLSLLAVSSVEVPACVASCCIRSFPSPSFTWLGEMGALGPLPIHEEMMSPSPFCWNDWMMPPNPPVSLLESISTIPLTRPEFSPPLMPRTLLVTSSIIPIFVPPFGCCLS